MYKYTCFWNWWFLKKAFIFIYYVYSTFADIKFELGRPRIWQWQWLNEYERQTTVQTSALLDRKKWKKACKTYNFFPIPILYQPAACFHKMFSSLFLKDMLDEWWDNTIIWFMYWGGIFINIVTMEAAISIQGQEDTSLIPLTLFLYLILDISPSLLHTLSMYRISPSPSNHYLWG